MKFRTKLYLSFGLTWLLIATVARIWFYVDVKHLLEAKQRSKAESLAITIAQTVSGDELSALLKKNDVTQPSFIHLNDYLSRVRKANQRSDVEIGSIYFIRQSLENPSQVEITIDAEDPPNLDTYFFRNELWISGQSDQILSHIHENWATTDLYIDKWGTWLTGIAPIYDSNGRYVVTAAVDLSAKSIQASLDKLLFVATVSGVAIFLIGLILATIMARIATRALNQITRAVEEIGRGNLKVHLEVKSKDEFGKLANAINKMEKGLEENARLKVNFIRYVSRHIMEKILTTDAAVTLTGERRKITVLFSDIRQFTTLSEKLPPEDVVSILNEYLEQMLNVIFDHNGTLDKFLGDGIMVEFGAPLEDTNQEKNAIETAIGMQNALHELNDRWYKEKGLRLEMGIGIHTGLAVVGNIGSEKRMEYTAIGDTVNIASMLEQESKKYKAKIVVSETSASPMKSEYKFKSLGKLKLPGRESLIEAFIIED